MSQSRPGVPRSFAIGMLASFILAASVAASDSVTRARPVGGAPVLKSRALLEVELATADGSSLPGAGAQLEAGVSGGAHFVSGPLRPGERPQLLIAAGATGQLDELRVLAASGELVATGRLALGSQPAGILRVLALGEMQELAQGARLGARLGERYTLLPASTAGPALEVADVIVLGVDLPVESDGAWHRLLAERVRAGCTLVVASAAAEQQLLAALAGRQGAASRLSERLRGEDSIGSVGAGKVVRWHRLSGSPEEAATQVGSLRPSRGSRWRPRGLARASSGARALLSSRLNMALIIWFIATTLMLIFCWWPRRSRMPAGARIALIAVATSGLAFVPVGDDQLARACAIEARRVIVVDATHGEDWVGVEEKVVVSARAHDARVLARQVAVQDLLDWKSGASNLREQSADVWLGANAVGWLEGCGSARIEERPLLIERAGGEVLIGNQLDRSIGPVLVLEGGNDTVRVIRSLPPGALETATEDRAGAQAAREELNGWIRTSSRGLGEGELLVLAALSPPDGGDGLCMALARSLLEVEPGSVEGARPDRGRLFWREIVRGPGGR